MPSLVADHEEGRWSVQAQRADVYQNTPGRQSVAFARFDAQAHWRVVGEAGQKAIRQLTQCRRGW